MCLCSLAGHEVPEKFGVVGGVGWAPIDIYVSKLNEVAFELL